MKEHNYPALEGLEILSAQAVAAIEAAEKAGKPSSNCEYCVKTKQTEHHGSTVEIPTTISIPEI